MDSRMLKDLKNFESVWKRVSNSTVPKCKSQKSNVKLMPRKEKSGCAKRFAPYK